MVFFGKLLFPYSIDQFIFREFMDCIISRDDHQGLSPIAIMNSSQMGNIERMDSFFVEYKVFQHFDECKSTNFHIQ